MSSAAALRAAGSGFDLIVSSASSITGSLKRPKLSASSPIGDADDALPPQPLLVGIGAEVAAPAERLERAVEGEADVLALLDRRDRGLAPCRRTRRSTSR